MRKGLGRVEVCKSAEVKTGEVERGGEAAELKRVRRKGDMESGCRPLHWCRRRLLWFVASQA